MMGRGTARDMAAQQQYPAMRRKTMFLRNRDTWRKASVAWKSTGNFFNVKIKAIPGRVYTDLFSIPLATGKVRLRWNAQFEDPDLEQGYQEYHTSITMDNARFCWAFVAIVVTMAIGVQLVGIFPDYYIWATIGCCGTVFSSTIGFGWVSLQPWGQKYAQLLCAVFSVVVTTASVWMCVLGHLSWRNNSVFSQYQADLMYSMHLPFFFTMAQLVCSTIMSMRFGIYVRALFINCVGLVAGFVYDPLPGGFPMLMQFLFLMLPANGMLCMGLVRNMDQASRHTFLLKRELEKENDQLHKKLTQANARIAKYQNPTVEEETAVQRLESDASIKSVAIPFEDLALQDVVGKGAFGEVIKATYRGLRVAVKRMLRSRIGQDASMELLAKEIWLLSRIKHPNIVTFIGASWDSVSNICVVLEFMERGTLRDITTNPDLDLTWENSKYKFALGIAQAMYYLHGRKPSVMHRDLKAENVLVSTYFEAKVSDFGSGRQVEDVNEKAEMTQAGTPMYMAPEVFVGYPYGPAADVFSYGLLLVELSNQQKPYQELRDSMPLMTILTKAATEELRPYVHPDNAPSRMHKLITRCLDADSDMRPTFKEVVRALQLAELEMTTNGGRSLRTMRDRKATDESVSGHIASSDTDFVLGSSLTPSGLIVLPSESGLGTPKQSSYGDLLSDTTSRRDTMSRVQSRGASSIRDRISEAEAEGDNDEDEDEDGEITGGVLSVRRRGYGGDEEEDATSLSLLSIGPLVNRNGAMMSGGDDEGKLVTTEVVKKKRTRVVGFDLDHSSDEEEEANGDYSSQLQPPNIVDLPNIPTI